MLAIARRPVSEWRLAGTPGCSSLLEVDDTAMAEVGISSVPHKTARTGVAIFVCLRNVARGVYISGAQFLQRHSKP